MRPAALWLLALFWLLAGAAGAPSIPEALPGAPPFPPELRERLAAALVARGPGYQPRTRHVDAEGSPLFTNRLLLETSPYLLQHAHNPVDWHPWGDEAFAEARRRKIPVLVSIGYSTCHWCHVMEEESFDDPEIAKLLNERFVAVKVDREVRPDVDAIYMSAAQAMGQRGGWPLNVWMTPDRKPFYAGTYFPPADRNGRPGLPRVLTGLAEQYAQDPGRFERFADGLQDAIARQLEGAEAPGGDGSSAPDETVLRNAAGQTLARIDREWGGIGPRPKFPATVPLRFLLRYHRRSGDPEALALTVLTLEKMAAGGLFDHVGGGFHRYSTDPTWLVPHFEKMLYDNALLASVYVEAWQATGRDDFADVARRTLDYVLREMSAPEGGFYSATDADSRGPDGSLHEGSFYTWTPAEIEAALPPPRARAAMAWFGVTAAGNFEGRNVLATRRTLAEVAAELETAPEALATTLETARRELYEARSGRPAPLRDDKILVAWNGLMISALARAGLAFDDAGYVQAATAAADFVLARMRDDGRLRRAWLDGHAAGPAFLEDYAFLIAGLLDLYEAAPDPRWIREALALQRVLDTHYRDPAGGAYFQSADDHEKLIAREKPATDGAVPSGNSVAALNLLRLADFTGDAALAARAAALLASFHDLLVGFPGEAGELLLALDYQLDSAKEVVLVAPASGEGLAPMRDTLRRRFVPNRVLAVVTQGHDLDSQSQLVPLVADKVAQDGRTTAYVCQNRVCGFPTSDPDRFAQELAEVEPLADPGASPDR